MKQSYQTHEGLVTVETRDVPGHEVKVVFSTNKGAITETLSLSTPMAAALSGMLKAASAE